MRTRIAILLVSLLYVAASSVPDEEQALQAFARFLELNKAGKLQSPEARALLIGEALDWTRETIGPFSGPADALIAISTDSLVVRVPVTMPNAEVKDFYFYLRENGGWKISAMRSLALTGIIYMVRDMDPNEIAAIPDGAYIVENARLTLRSDHELRSWFAEHSDELRRVAALVGESSTELHRVKAAELNETAILKDLRGLALSSARRLPNGVEFVIGGMVDNHVGFLHLRSGAPPPISPRNYIWIESLGEGWYLFRTT